MADFEQIRHCLFTISCQLLKQNFASLRTLPLLAVQCFMNEFHADLLACVYARCFPVRLTAQTVGNSKVVQSEWKIIDEFNGAQLLKKAVMARRWRTVGPSEGFSPELPPCFSTTITPTNLGATVVQNKPCGGHLTQNGFMVPVSHSCLPRLVDKKKQYWQQNIICAFMQTVLG